MCFEKKKKANPTIGYIFINVPNKIKQEAQNSFSFSIKTKERMNRILAENTGKEYEVIAADTERDNWKTAEEAKEYGLIDMIITSHEDYLK